MADIRQTGNQSWRELQKENASTFNPETATPQDWYRQLKKRDYNSYSSQPTEYVGVEAAQAGFGNSRYDEGLVSTTQLNDLNDIRYQNQPWYDTLANGVVKMLGTAGTTFLSSLVGIPAGIGTAISEGRVSGLWDNSVTQAMGDTDKWFEENFTNYKSTEQQNAPWYSPTNLLSMNFWADDFIKNAGFTLGAAASMAVGSGSLGLISRAFGAVNQASKGAGMAGKFISALMAATGEGMIEARNGVEERNKLETQRLEDALAPERQAIAEELALINEEYNATKGQSLITGADGRAYDPAYLKYSQRIQDLNVRQNDLNQRYAAGLQQIEETGREMGNKILLGNQALLTAGNLIQFGKLMNKSFDNARHAAEITSKSIKPFGVAVKRAGENLKDGYKVAGKNFGRTVAATKGILTEGSEEMNQQWIQNTAGYLEQAKDANDYWKAMSDSDASKSTIGDLYNLGNAINQGFKDSWGDVNQWEQFAIGALTGMAGSYAPTKIFNQDKTKSRWDPRRYGSWEGGAYNTVRDFNEQYRQQEENVEDLNKILAQENFGERTRSLIAHTYLENQKEDAALAGDMKRWKDEDDKQAIHDIQAFLRAGKIDDLRAIYEEMGKNMSDEDIQGIIKATTQEISADRDKKNHDDAIDAKIAEHRARIDSLNARANKIAEDAGMFENVEEIASYNNSVHPAIEKLYEDVDKEYAAIDELEQQKNYAGQTRYVSPYLNEDGSQRKTNDEIREEIKHNSDEMNRKLNSYLDSVEQVNRDTRGRVSKDQEDNLAYLHFMGRESQNRFLKTISKRRADMPQTFLLKTDKTPEKLTEEYGTSDLVFSKNDRTPDGYVEANTSMMTDNDFANFFMREVMWGGNISTEFGETADEKAQKEEDEKKKSDTEKPTAKTKATEEKRKKEQQEQQSVNVKRMKNEFVQNYRKNNNATIDEALKEWKKLKQDVKDASDLLNQAGQYRRTLFEYMLTPEKVDQDKAKEEKKAEKQAKKDDVKGMSVRDLSNRDDLNELFSEAQKENDITLMNKIKKAQVLREKKANLDAADGESNLNGADVSDEENAALEILRQQVENDIDDDSTIDDKKAQTAKELTDLVADVDEGLIDSYVDEHAVVNIDPKTGAKTLSLKRGALSPEERSQQAQFEAENPEEYDRQKTILIDRIHNSVRSIDDRMNELLSKIDDTDIVSEDVAKMQKYTDQVKEDENLPDIEPEKKNDRNNPVQTVPNTPETPIERRPVDGIGEEAALTSDMRQGTENGLQISSNSGQHPWQIISGRVGYHTNEPYSNTLRKLVEDPNVSEENKKIYRKQLKRAEAVEKFLSNEESGAYTRVENGGAQRRSTVKFKVFREVNEAAEDFVIFITDDKGNILGDLPSSDPDIDPNTEKRTGLAALYEESRKQLDENADATELELRGIESEIDFEYIGKPQYRKEGEPRKTVNELFNNGEFTLALKVSDNNEDNPVVKVDTGKKSFKGKLEMDAIKDPLTGNVGQPYILIPTSQAARKNNTGRGYWAVPIATPTFGEIDKSSVFYRTVKQTLESIRDGKLSETEAKTRLGELFGVANFHVNFTEGESKKEPGIRATTYIRQDGSEKGAPHTLYVGDRASMDVETVLNELGRFFINISNSRINSKETYTTVDGTSYTYNQMIGEIATTDAVRPHTVNDWFTIRPVEKKGNKWVKSETPTQRIPYPSGSEKAVFHVTIPYQDGTKHVWTISPRDWTVRDEQGRPIMLEDGVHSKEEANVAAIQMARAYGRYYMKDMSKPYVVLVGEQSRLFDPTNNTFKAAQELEEAPKYKKGQSFSSAEAEYDFLTTIEQARAEKAAGGGTSSNQENEDEEAQKAINRERTEATIKKIKEDSADFVLADGNGNEDPDGDYYKNKKTGELHARVTSVKEGDTRVLPFKETDDQGNRNPWITPSTTIGNAVDEFVRLFFEGQDPESSVLTQNLSDKTKQHLREELEKIQKSLGTKWKVAASGIKAVGNITVKDANGDDMVIRVAGTLDLLLYNPEKNEYAIYDMKTHRGGVEDKKLGWAAQLSLYKQLLEARYPEMRGKIKGLKIIPFTTSGYDANKQSYDTDDSGRLTSNGEIVKAEVKYDGSTIDMTKDEMNLNISFARPGFKKEYVSGVGANKIIVSKPQPKLEEAPKERVKEGFVKSINKIADNDSVKTFLKPKFRDNKEAITLAEKLDKARKDSNLGELCLTLGEMNLLQDMLNTRMIDRVAARSEMINRGLDVPAAETPEADVAEGSQDIDAIAEEKGILSTATRKAWNKLTDENKEKIVQLRRGVKDVKRELKECQRLGKDPNSVIAGYLHRKADETSGYTIIDMKKELAWLDRVLPKLSKESRIRIIEGLIKCSDGTFDYGQIKQGLVYIATNGKEGTVYHEAFHAVTQWILTDNELDRLYKAAKERYGNLDTVVLEEKLADDFMRYTMGFEPSYKKHDLNIFQKLWQAIKNMFKHTSMIDKLYRDINDGIYADSVLRTNNNEFAHITEEDRQISMKYQFLDKEQQQRLKDEKISQEQYEVLDADEKRYLFHCVI